MIMIDPYVLGIVLVVAALALGLVQLLKRHRRHSVRDEQIQQRLKARREAQAEFAMATETAMLDLKSSVEGLATCLANLELRLRTVDARQRKLDEQSAQLLRRRGFDEAVTLVRDGKSTDEIASRCGMPLAEVELLQRVQRRSLGH